MTTTKFEHIYTDLKKKIEQGTYTFQSMLPGEIRLSQEYGCSRMTVRRSLFKLQSLGYIQAIQGMGTQVIWQPIEQAFFLLGEIESFKETAVRNHLKARTKVIRFETIIADDKFSARTGFAIGSEILEVHRVRFIKGKPLILDKNYFLKSAVGNLTKQIARKSIYEYFEGVLGMKIMTSKRHVTVELADEYDQSCLELGEFNCLAVITGRTYNSDGVQFEYTQSRHHPDYFCFEDTATRKAVGG